MAIASGTRLGPYEIAAPLGAGGMGEVYRARDSRLGREVAIKVLPAEVANDPERLRRFEQEARAVSALNHPAILTVHDFGSHDGVAFLVTELLSGETLRALLARGPVGEKRAAELARQIARGLAAAHEKGIVHRDLKPENLFVTREGTIKILDFGLARIDRPELVGAGMQDASTVLGTSAGTVLGTVGYMAPEQVRGERADPRSDLFSLGVVVHEMLAGSNPFRRESVVESLNAILKETAPELGVAPGTTSPSLSRVVARLLEKDPARRFHSAADLAFALEALGDAPASARLAPVATPALAKPALALALVALLGAAVAVSYRFGVRSTPLAKQNAIRFQIPPPSGTAFVANTAESVPLAVSPDGKQLAFVGFDSGIWIRPLDELEARRLAGTEGATSLTWSPDGRSLAYFAGGKLRRLDLASGSSVVICDVAPGIGYAASWGSLGDILFASVQGDAILRVPASGGTPEKVVEANPEKGDFRAVWPLYLADGRSFLYLVRRPEKRFSLMLSDAGRVREVASIASRIELAGDDWLIFARDGALLAQKLDRAAGKLVGSALSVAPKVKMFFSSGWAGFAASPSGTIVLFDGRNSSRLRWFDRTGRALGEVGAEGNYLHLALSPDGRSVLVDRTAPELGTYDLWRIDLERGVETRLTDDPDADFDGVWLPDGKSIVYSKVGTKNPVLARRDLGSGRDELLLPGPGFQSATDISRDGRLLAFVERNEGRFHAFTLPLEGERRATRLFAQEATEGSVRFSPDGRFVAYISDLSGEDQAYVAPLERTGESVRISLHGAQELRFSRDGREIFILGSDRRMVAVPIRFTPELEAGAPSPLFEIPAGPGWLDFDVAPDGQRFLALVRERSAGMEPATVIVGWSPGAAH